MTTQLFLAGEEQIFKLFIEQKNYDQCIILADAKSNGFCLKPLYENLSFLKYASLITIPDGEYNKSVDILTFIWDELIRLKASKNAVLINVGGGVLSDIGGFSAATYKRGIDYINIPTTLLSMVDASLGGKTAIDLQGIKNAIGVFKHPEAIYLNPIFLNSLPNHIKISGIAEMLKHALIESLALWEEYKLFALEDFFKLNVIQNALHVKRQWVLKDELDGKERQALNLGHTIGHAIESYALHTAQPLLHGEAIMLGLYYELEISEHLFNVDISIRKDLKQFIIRFFPHLKCQHNYKDLLPYLIQDKKNDGSIRMSLIKSIGDVALQVEVDPILLQKVLMANE
jgi:3-dehydroquinate synthase